MILSLGACGGNASVAADHYRHRYPNRWYSDRRVLQRAERTLGDFLENKASNEKFLFYIFDYFFRVESPPFRLYHQLSTILYIGLFLPSCFFMIIIFFHKKDHSSDQSISSITRYVPIISCLHVPKFMNVRESRNVRRSHCSITINYAEKYQACFPCLTLDIRHHASRRLVGFRNDYQQHTIVWKLWTRV